MTIRCRADSLIIEALQRPADFGIPFSKRALHKIMTGWAAAAAADDQARAAFAARRAARRLAAAAAGEGERAGSPLDGDDQADELDQQLGFEDEEEDELAAEDGQSLNGSSSGGGGDAKPARTNQRQVRTLARLEAVHDAMRRAGLDPDATTLYILIRAAHTAGLRDRAARYAQQYKEANGDAPLKPTAARLLAALGPGGGGDGE
jgi:hypothetical protein